MKAAGLNRAQQIAYSTQITRSQNDLAAKIASLGGKEVGRVRIAYNAILVHIDANKLGQLASLPGVSSIQHLNDYQLDLSETVPYIGAAAVQAAGVTGKGVNVAVLDSGIDYTHRNLGGAGTLAAYTAAWGTSSTDPRNTTLDGLFPTAKVIGGYDFVGELWDGTDASPPLATGSGSYRSRQPRLARRGHHCRQEHSTVSTSASRPMHR